MKCKLLLFSLFLMTNAFSQSNYYISKSNDTIRCEIIWFTSKKLKVNVNGEDKKFSPKDIMSFNFRGNKFVSLMNDYNNFYKEIISGKLSFYNVFGNNAYDGSSIIFPIMVKDDKIVWLNVINPKERIAKLISDCPELYNEWVEGSKYSLKEKEAIVNAYNECVSKKH
ncbi:hypothetical protein [Flavobacterium algicola]|uniref:hypothetical protein n=1 Tax=Flavobacterium algicola TaxID=556529 RepID=UPI001EFD30D9|nr:hypothetical protein [Flavobacterium algicola]MCG9791027.1 hypothetical protein [Flavobacterium algicola]